jgi:GT2 family glycosyltransferase
MSAPVTVIVVAFADPSVCVRAAHSALAQTRPPLELLVVDNDPRGTTAKAMAEDRSLGQARVIHPGRNLGYVRAVNLAAERAGGEWLFLLNPDAVAQSDCLERLLCAVDGPDVALVGAQVLLADGRTNAGENPVSIVGISWAGGLGRERERGEARDVAAVSGAALLVRREVFLSLGGLCPWFFMYFDDTDLAWRVRMSGRRVRYCPQAVVVHDYEFQKGAHKWFYLERNRLWALLSNLRLLTLMLLAPLLIVTEVVVTIHAISQGWLAEKVRAWLSLLRDRRQLIKWRRSVQIARHVSDYRVLSQFCGPIEAAPLDGGVPAWANDFLECYHRALLRVLAAVARERSARGSRRP